MGSLIRNRLKRSCAAGGVLFSASAFANGVGLPSEFFGLIAIVGLAVGSFSVAVNAKASHLLLFAAAPLLILPMLASGDARGAIAVLVLASPFLAGMFFANLFIRLVVHLCTRPRQ